MPAISAPHLPLPLLRIRDLAIAYNKTAIVHGVNFDLNQGDTLALVGESGCGKSTTALAIAGLLPAYAQACGSIQLQNTELLKLRSAQLRRIQGKDIGVIFQEPLSSLNPVLTIGAQIIEVLLNHKKVSKQEALLQAHTLLDQVQLPQTRTLINKYPHELSGGQRQRVMIAIAIACKPRLLIADEPTTALDVTTQAQVLNLLDELKKELAMSLLLITHDLGVVSERANHVAVMRSGEIVEQNQTQAVFSSPQHAYSRSLLASSLRKDKPLHYKTHRLPEPTTTSQTHAPLFALPSQPRRCVLEVKNLHKSFVRKNETTPLLAVNNMSFNLYKGETLGLVGQSGCGKSTLSRLLLRLLSPDSGQVLLDGQDFHQAKGSALKKMRSKIQMIFQDPYGSLNPRHRIGDALDQLLRAHTSLNTQHRRKEIIQTLDAVGLSASALKRYPHEFSGGQRQRIAIARALLLKPAVIVCDEAVSALDVSIQAQVLNLLVDLRNEFALSYLFISHDLSVVRYISDRIMVMNEGQILESNQHDALWNRPQHAYTKRLIHAIPSWSPAFALTA